MESLKIIVLVLLKIISVLATSSNIVIVTDLSNGTILTGPIDTLELAQIPLQDVSRPVGVDYDPVEQRVYWTDVVRNTINRAFLNGSGQEVLLSLFSAAVPDGITVDVENRHIYWTDAGEDAIERANLDGSGRQIILEDNHDQPRAIVVDSAGGHLYWTDWGENQKIERAKVDGSERVTLVDTDLQFPNGLAVDFSDQRIYWCDAGNNKIETTDLNGDDRKVLFSITNPDIHPFDIAVYDTNIYWTDWNLPKLVKMDKYLGQVAEAVGPSVFSQPGGIHIHQEHDGSCSTNVCENGSRCRQLIVGYQCACLPGYTGEYCGSDINECGETPSVCATNADCANTVGSYSCQCIVGYSGDGKTSCTTFNECSSYPCINGGRCYDGDNAYICDCTSTGWQGERCQTDENECEQTPSVCHINADCINTVGSYNCQCKSGYSGDGKLSCTDKNECEQTPSLCHINADCINTVGSYNCQCKFGYSGDGKLNCTALADPCDNQPCKNGATCQRNGDQFACQCLAGYTGNTCETDINECVSSPCRNGGTCMDLVNEFECRCDTGYEGVTCEAEDSTEFTGCPHPGSIEHGYVIPDNTNEMYPAGKKVEYVCQENYKLKGSKDTYCQIDSTWSHARPSCEKQNGGNVSTLVVVGAGAGGCVVILILVIILIYICLRNRKSRRSTFDDGIPVQYSRGRHPGPKKEGQYNPGYERPCPNRPYTPYQPTPSPSTIARTHSMHLYEDLDEILATQASGRYPNRDPPTYEASIFNNTTNEMNAGMTNEESKYMSMHEGVNVGQRKNNQQ